VTATDWDHYYRNAPFTAHLTRRYTQSVLLSVMRRSAPAGVAAPVIVEIGGANSCFLDAICAAIRPRAYHVIDRNEYGLGLLHDRVRHRADVFLHQEDVLQLKNSGLRADIVFSVGLVEHFDKPGTRQAIRAHFDLLNPGGHAIISFPTPTWLYSSARSIVEKLGKWQFTDERPLPIEEVRNAVSDLGNVVFEKTLWPLVFTQHLMAIRKQTPCRPL
jgi:SAM-dependent methyltransferase